MPWRYYVPGTLRNRKVKTMRKTRYNRGKDIINRGLNPIPYGDERFTMAQDQLNQAVGNFPMRGGLPRPTSRNALSTLRMGAGVPPLPRLPSRGTFMPGAPGYTPPPILADPVPVPDTSIPRTPNVPQRYTGTGYPDKDFRMFQQPIPTGGTGASIGFRSSRKPRVFGR